MSLPPFRPLSYGGGLFNVGELILKPFREAISELNMLFIEPRLSPVEGAVLLAVDHFCNSELSRVRQGLLDNYVK
jgi:hypothetical protein